jgi:beta-1,4-mannosyltransferase
MYRVLNSLGSTVKGTEIDHVSQTQHFDSMSDAPTSPQQNMPRITVVVLGDVGRSPRMQYHSKSLAEFSSVRLVGLRGEECIPEITKCCDIVTINDVTVFQNVPWLLRAPLRAVGLSFKLFFVLIASPCDLLLVQNPPAIPTLFVSALAAWWLGAALVVDWHNLGFKMLQSRYGYLDSSGGLIST